MISIEEPLLGTGISDSYPAIKHFDTSSSHSYFVVINRDSVSPRELPGTPSWLVEEAKRLIDTNLATIVADYRDDATVPTVEEDDKMDIGRLKESIADQFGKLNQIEAVYLFPHKDYVEVHTVLRTRNRRIRDRLFSYELRIHDAFPNLLIDFRVIFSSHDISTRDLPSDTIVCFSR